MKIENKWFQFIWEKKKRGGAWLPLLLCVALLACSFGSGMLVGNRLGSRSEEGISVAGGQVNEPGTTLSEGQPSSNGGSEEPDTSDTFTDAEDDYVEGIYVTSAYLAETARAKYTEARSPYGYTYGPAITGLKRDEGITIQASRNFYDSVIEYWTEAVELFEDPQLIHSVGYISEYDKETNILTLNPSNYPTGLIGLSRLDTVTASRYRHDDLQLFPYDSGKDWGNLGTMYLALYIDPLTGEKLDIPQVQIVTLEGELPDTPQLTYSFMDDGRVRFKWTQVPGAEEYFVCYLDFSEQHGMGTFNWVIDSTTETEWISKAPEYGSISANSDFRNYEVAENEWYSNYEYSRNRVIEKYGEEPTYIYKTDSRRLYTVIAVSKEGSSMMSNPVDILDLQSNIPVYVANDTWRANGYITSGAEKVEDLPPYGYVTMADGSTAMRLLDYDTENAMIIEDRYIFLDENDNYLEGRNVKVLKIPYRIEGTPFEDTIRIADYDESLLERDLQYIEEREELLRKRAGDVAMNSDVEFEEEEAAPAEIRQVDIPITANSALSEYLAMNMLSGVSVIDVSEFPEAADTSMLIDAFFEAYYQNPLILGVSGYKVNRRGNAIKVVYDESASVQAGKQEEIRQKVGEIIAEIITPGMTELERELAINQYLCDTCTYDDDALDNAALHDYQYTDEEFIDSFTAYGALINGKCVCAGYAAAFKLLADAAGLDSVVVTGVLEGNLAHAWNKVRIDGEWEILDVTNNDNEFLPNALLNLPDEAGRRSLTEDSDYVLDGYLDSYACTNGQREYYRLNGMYYSYAEIGEKLVEQLSANGEALLRTEYALDDDTFQRIGQEVYDILGDDVDLYGYYWLGVIYLTY